ncbi:MAG: aminotransferase class V-fold PLP-dependent enzyme [Clostridia bacterium]|nr:aminotransferase class V-fold PLP-dependent enzyme [Clostridia bacterium]
MIYLDNAATTGIKPPEVKAAVNNAMKNYCANPGRGGHKRSVMTSSAVYGVRLKLSDFFGGAGGEKVAFTANCTHAINFVIKGLVKPNDHVVVSDLEHNAVMRPLLSATDNFSVFEVSLDDDNKTLENLISAINAETKLVICTAASNVIGKILPIKEIGEICRERGIYFAVDAAQGGGVIPIDMLKMNIDFLCVAPHKGLYAPMGTGVLIANKELERTVIEGGNGIDSLSLIQKPDMPEGIESGTVSVPGIMGIGAGVDFVKKLGIKQIYRHELNLVKYLYDGLEKAEGVILYAPKPTENQYAPVISFNLENKNSEETAMYLNEKGIAVRAGYHCSFAAHNKLNTTNTGTVRVSPCVFNTFDEISKFIYYIKKMQK